MKKYFLFLLLLLPFVLQAMNNNKTPDSDGDVFYSCEESSYESDSDNELPLLEKLIKKPLSPRESNVPNAIAKTVVQKNNNQFIS